MAREAKTKSIGGSSYTVGMLPAMEGFAILQDLMRIALPTLGALVHTVDLTQGLKGILGQELNLEAAARALMQAHDKQTVNAIVMQLAKHTVLDGKLNLADCIDVQFQGEYGHMFTWLTFALGANHERFFSWLESTTSHAAGIAQAAAPAKPAA